jgi:hypothetical protein
MWDLFLKLLGSDQNWEISGRQRSPDPVTMGIFCIPRSGVTIKKYGMESKTNPTTRNGLPKQNQRMSLRFFTTLPSGYQTWKWTISHF